MLRRKPSHVLMQFGHNDQPGKGLDRETDIDDVPREPRALRRRGARDRREADSHHAAHAVTTTRKDASAPTSSSTPRRRGGRVGEERVPLIDLHAKSIGFLDDLALQ